MGEGAWPRCLGALSRTRKRGQNESGECLDTGVPYQDGGLEQIGMEVLGGGPDAWFLCQDLGGERVQRGWVDGPLDAWVLPFPPPSSKASLPLCYSSTLKFKRTLSNPSTWATACCPPVKAAVETTLTAPAASVCPSS